MTGHLDSYQIYKTCLVPWLNEMPDHWAADRLKTHVASIANPASGPEHDEPYIALEHVESWTGKIRAEETTVDFDSQAKRFCPGDVLFGKLRPYLAKVARPERDGVCVGEFLVLRCQDQYFIPSYLEHLMRSKPIIDAIDASTFGAKMPRANWDFIGNLRLPIPPLTEQTAIVRYLDDADQRIRAYVSAKERLIVLLEEERQAVIHQAVTRGLDPNVKLNPSGVEWLGDVPKHWQLTTVKRHYQVQLGKMLQPRPNSPDDVQVPYLKAQHVHRNHIRIETPPTMWATPNELERFGIRQGDVLIVEGGAGAGTTSLLQEIPGGYIIQNAIHRVRPRNQTRNELLTLIMEAVASSGWIDAINNKATIPHFTKEKLDYLPITLPPITEQNAIVEYSDKATTAIEQAIVHARRQIELMEEYRTRLIADVVTGKIDVREAKP